MRIVYNQHLDTLTIIFNDTLVAESDENKSGIILDYDEEGNVVSMEILDASRRAAQPTHIVYEVANQPA